MDPIIDIKPNGTIHAVYYTYQRSIPAAWTFVFLFAIATITHLVLVFPFKAAYFLPLIIGGINTPTTGSHFRLSSLLSC